MLSAPAASRRAEVNTPAQKDKAAFRQAKGSQAAPKLLSRIEALRLLSRVEEAGLLSLGMRALGRSRGRLLPAMLFTPAGAPLAAVCLWAVAHFRL